MAGFIEFTRRSETGVKAVEIAQAQYGADYKYYLTGIRWQGSQVRADLLAYAYNEKEIKPVTVEWKHQ